MGAGLTIIEYWRCTPYEIGVQCEGRGVQVETMQALAAWHLAPILNIVLPKGRAPITPAELLGKTEAVNDLNISEIRAKAAKIKLGIE